MELKPWQPNVALAKITNLAIGVPNATVEFLAVDNQVIHAGLDNATLDGDGTGRVDVVTRHHAHSDACPLALSNSFGYLFE